MSKNRSYTGAQIVQSVARSEPRYYVERMLPVVTDTILNTGHNQDDMLNRLWPSLSNVGNPRSIDDAILLALRKALQHLATHDVGAFRAHVTPVLSYPHQTFGYLTLRSWQGQSARVCRRLCPVPCRGSTPAEHRVWKLGWPRNRHWPLRHSTGCDSGCITRLFRRSIRGTRVGHLVVSGRL